MKKLLFLLFFTCFIGMQAMEHPKDDSLYQVLQVGIDATSEAIKSNYKKLSMTFHPDRYASASKSVADHAAEKFKDINHAYQVLSDSEAKKAYDKYGLPGVQAFFAEQGKKRQERDEIYRTRDAYQTIFKNTFKGSSSLAETFKAYDQALSFYVEKIRSSNDEMLKNEFKETTINNCRILALRLHSNALELSQYREHSVQKAVLYIDNFLKLGFLSTSDKEFSVFQDLKKGCQDLLSPEVKVGQQMPDSASNIPVQERSFELPKNEQFVHFNVSNINEIYRKKAEYQKVFYDCAEKGPLWKVSQAYSQAFTYYDNQIDARNTDETVKIDLKATLKNNCYFMVSTLYERALHNQKYRKLLIEQALSSIDEFLKLTFLSPQEKNIRSFQDLKKKCQELLSPDLVQSDDYHKKSAQKRPFEPPKNEKHVPNKKARVNRQPQAAPENQYEPIDNALYAVLGVATNTSQQAIKNAFNNLLKHMDKDSEQCKKMSEAYRILTDPETKMIYDRHGLKAVYSFLNNRRRQEQEIYKTKQTIEASINSLFITNDVDKEKSIDTLCSYYRKQIHLLHDGYLKEDLKRTLVNHLYKLALSLKAKEIFNEAFYTLREAGTYAHNLNGCDLYPKIIALVSELKKQCSNPCWVFEHTCREMQKIMRSSENFYSIKIVLLEKQPWCTKFLNDLNDLGQRIKYEQQMSDMYYNFAQKLMQSNLLTEALEMINSALSFCKIPNTIEKFMALQNQVEAMINLYAKKDEDDGSVPFDFLSSNLTDLPQDFLNDLFKK